MTISVVVATYNGARFLSEQLDSIAEQSFRPTEVIISDDGSTDDTLSIAGAFRERAPFPVRIRRNEENLGYSDNFLTAANETSSTWIAFCDQDDVWHPNKLRRCLDELERTEDAVMVVHASEMVRENLDRTGVMYPRISRRSVRRRNEMHGFSVLPGFSKLVRSDLIRDLPWDRRPRSWHQKDPRLTHDKWTNVQANALGATVLVPEPLALYRRHGKTVTSSRKSFGVMESIQRALKTPSDHYAYRAGVALELAEFQEGVAATTETSDRADRLRENAELYRTLSGHEQLRASVHSEVASAAEVWRSLATLSLRGAYLGPHFHRLTAASLAKDVATGLRRSVDLVLR